MPTYEYECKACGHAFEAFHSITAGARRKCPECGRLQLRRLVGSGGGIIFKGSGFYETDYKRKSPGRSGGKPDSGSNGSTSDATPEADAAGKSDAAPKADAAGKSDAAGKAGAAGKTGEGDGSGSGKSEGAGKKGASSKGG